MSLRKAYQEMIKVQGVADTAALLDMSEDAMDNRVYERQGQDFKVRQALRLQKISGTTRFAEAVAVESGGTFVNLPSIDEVDNQSLLTKFNQLHAKLGELSASFSEYTKDDELTDRECASLKGIGDEVHQTMEELLALTFAIYRR